MSGSKRRPPPRPWVALPNSPSSEPRRHLAEPIGGVPGANLPRAGASRLETVSVLEAQAIERRTVASCRGGPTESGDAEAQVLVS